MTKYSKIQIELFDIMKVEDCSHVKLFKRLKETGAAPVCKRCGGSGRYSYNLKDGSVCYGCSGSGIIIKNESELLKIASTKEVQEKLENYLHELAIRKVKKEKSMVNSTTENNEEKESQNPQDSLQNLYSDAIERMDWEFVVRVMISLKNKGIKSEGKLASEKQLSYIKSLAKRGKLKEKRDIEGLMRLINDCEEKHKIITHTEVNYIINWLTEK